MNTKKSKFQERLDAIAKNYDPEEDRGSLNDKLNLHKMETNEDDIKVFSITDMNNIITELEKSVIPLSEMPQDPDARDSHYGYNTALRSCVDYLKKVTRDGKLKLHNP
jgi:hypothetical protein